MLAIALAGLFLAYSKGKASVQKEWDEATASAILENSRMKSRETEENAKARDKAVKAQNDRAVKAEADAGRLRQLLAANKGQCKASPELLEFMNRRVPK